MVGPPGSPVSATRPSDRAFGLVFAALFAFVTLIGWLLAGRVLLWSAATALALLLTALLAPGLLLPLNRIWGLLGARLALLVNRVLLSLFFYLVILPFGLASRLRGGLLRRRPDPDAQTYWGPVRRQARADNYLDMF